MFVFFISCGIGFNFLDEKVGVVFFIFYEIDEVF
jgi:hypothetical protein